MVQIIALVLFVAAGVFWWRFAAKRKKKSAAPPARRNTGKNYHCVEVRPGTPACKVARDLGSTRFLSDEAPSLPLAGCTVEKCTCSFVHHDDRREDDRRHPYKQWAGLPPMVTGERRAKTERRKSESTFKPRIGS
jgi:hypothetical protein